MELAPKKPNIVRRAGGAVKQKWTQLSRRKKILLAVGLLLLVLLLAFLVRGAFSGGAADDAVFVQPVSQITETGDLMGRYAGVVEAPKTETVQADSSLTVKDVLVSEGDQVQSGTALFTYDTEKISLDKEQLELEIAALKETVKSNTTEMESLRKERQKATSSADRMSYDAQIQVLQADINTGNYDIKTKEAEAQRLQSKMDNATVYSPVTGVVQKVTEPNEAAGEEGEAAGNTGFISIMANGNLMVKGKVNEQNMGEISEDMTVLVRSRADATKTWTGRVSSLDTSGPAETENQDMYAMEGESNDGMSTSSSYLFHVALDNPEGLLLGQHVTIEPDVGQDAARTGLWLNEMWIVQDDDAAYVWAAGSNNRLKKVPVELGEYDEELGDYEILSGLDLTAQIAWPDEFCREGAPVMTDDEMAMEA